MEHTNPEDSKQRTSLGSDGLLTIENFTCHVQCCICKSTPSKAYSCSNGHYVCSNCYSDNIRINDDAKCPIRCGDVMVPNQFLNNILKSLMSDCPTGCGYTGNLDELEEHRNTCPELIISCPCCSLEVIRRQVVDHLSGDCKFVKRVVYPEDMSIDPRDNIGADLLKNDIPAVFVCPDGVLVVRPIDGGDFLGLRVIGDGKSKSPSRAMLTTVTRTFWWNGLSTSKEISIQHTPADLGKAEEVKIELGNTNFLILNTLFSPKYISDAIGWFPFGEQGLVRECTILEPHSKDDLMVVIENNSPNKIKRYHYIPLIDGDSSRIGPIKTMGDRAPTSGMGFKFHEDAPRNVAEASAMAYYQKSNAYEMLYDFRQ